MGALACTTYPAPSSSQDRRRRSSPQAKQAQDKLEAAYPQLFVSDKEITARKKDAADAVRTDEDFKRLSEQRADAYRAQPGVPHHADRH